MLKRILTVQDISCVGKCSLAAALPVISALGVECSVLPTAVLSTHTGGFGAPEVCDLTDRMDGIAAHHLRAGLEFDAIYSGYLASAAQIDSVLNISRTLAADGAKLIVDPVMGDGGKLYSRFDGAFVDKMRTLAAAADIVIPNITEAALLTGSEYDAAAGEEYAFNLAEKLCAIGARSVVITGVSRGEEIGAAVLSDGMRYSHFAPREPRSYFGTGDIFASVVTAAAARGRTLDDAVRAAVEFTAECIRASNELPEHRRYGTAFEKKLGMLTELSAKWDN